MAVMEKEVSEAKAEAAALREELQRTTARGDTATPALLEVQTELEDARTRIAELEKEGMDVTVEVERAVRFPQGCAKELLELDSLCK